MTKSGSTSPLTLDIVVPCYNEEEVLPITVRELTNLIAEMNQSGLIHEASQIIFVDDGSQDATWSLIESYSEEYSNVVGVRLARNSGHQNALLAGLAQSDAEVTLSIDADLQDDLTVVSEMIQKIMSGADVVYGIRSDRSSDSGFKRVTAEGYYKTLSVLGVDVIENHADFRMMTRTAVSRLLNYQESNLYLRGIVPLVGHRPDSVYYRRLDRQAGETKYPLKKMIALAVDGITSFSPVPLRLIAALGMIVFVVSFLMGLWVLWVRLMTDNAVPGWASTLLPTFFIGGIQLLSLGVIGEYIAKIYMESKHRPRYFIEAITEKERG